MPDSVRSAASWSVALTLAGGVLETQLPKRSGNVVWGLFWARQYGALARGRLPRTLSWGKVHGHAVHVLQVAGNALKQTFGQFLTLFGLLQELFVGGIAEEGNLREDRRHVRADEHHKRRFAHATVSYAPAELLNSLRERVLDVLGKAPFVVLIGAD